MEDTHATSVGLAVIDARLITAYALWYSVSMSVPTDCENARPARRLDAQLLSHVVLLQIVGCNASIEGGEAVLNGTGGSCEPVAVEQQPWAGIKDLYR